MPKLKTNLYKPHRAWTRIPNVLIDRLMPELKDTELRVLLVILRQTIGWNRPDASVVISYRRLTASTGRQSEAIANALSSLTKLGLIHASRRRVHRQAKQDASGIEEQ